MHMCCSNCSLYPLKSLLHKGIDVKGFWFNPNIHPLPEYRDRLNSLRSLQKMWDLDIEYKDHYGFDDFVRGIGNQGGNRCIHCYAMRLEETAKTARKMSLQGFTTSLLVSPYQKHSAIVDVGREIGKRHSIAFYEEDFRAGYKDSIPLSRDLGLYRQRYCGCVFSEEERRGTGIHG